MNKIYKIIFYDPFPINKNHVGARDHCNYQNMIADGTWFAKMYNDLQFYSVRTYYDR